MEILILDGGLGTTLEDQYNIKFSIQTPLWSSHLLITDQNTLRKVQHDFSKYSDIILTPTYQASHIGFKKTGIEEKDISKYFKSGIEISRETGKIVALSLGAYGAILQPSQEYSGKYDIDEEGLVKFHQERLNVCEGYDLIAFETIPRLNEIRAVKRVAKGKYWISCVFPNENKLPDGSTIEEVVKTMMVGSRPWAIGMNCTKVEKISKLILEFEEVGERLGLKLPRLVIYPDGTNGLIYDTTVQKWIGIENEGKWDEQVGEIVKEVVNRNKWEGIVVGGCCKTTPEHIMKLRSRLGLD